MVGTSLPCKEFSEHEIEDMQLLKVDNEMTHTHRRLVSAVLDRGYTYGGQCRLCSLFIVLKSDEVNPETMKMIKKDKT